MVIRKIIKTKHFRAKQMNPLIKKNKIKNNIQMKNLKLIFILTILLNSVTSKAQIGIGTTSPNASAKLDITSTTQGFLPPRVALTGTTDVSTIKNTAGTSVTPATGLLVYNTATAGTAPNDVAPGYYYWNGSAWSALTANGITKKSGFVGRGVDVTLDNLKVRFSATGNAGLQVSTVSGTYSVYGSNRYVSSGNYTGSLTIDGASQLTINTTPTYLWSSLNFLTAGNIDEWMIMDTSAKKAWRISIIFGSGFLINLITIEQIL